MCTKHAYNFGGVLTSTCMHVRPDWHNVVRKTLKDETNNSGVKCCAVFQVYLITVWVKHSWYTRSVQYLISQQRLHDRTDAQTLYVSQESKLTLSSTEILNVYKLLVDSFRLVTYVRWIKDVQTHQVWACSESFFKPCAEYISCLHPGALNSHVWKHISDVPRLPFAFMSHIKWKFDLACLHRISSSPFLNPYGQAEGEGN